LTGETAIDTAEFEALLDYVRLQRGFDFSGYKRPSLTRRITKRMQTRGVETFTSYRELLEREPDEFAELFDTILINVTSFFRDAPTWDYVREEIVPRIVENHNGDSIRIWSTGCATGEEAFTIAMVFADVLGEEEFRRRVKIYATDVDEPALNIGRHGIYGPTQVEPVPPAYRERYFERAGTGYVFRNELRRSVIFGRHDLVQDPPISRIDLLVSRNTLMYFTPDAQTQILANFHFALRDDGFMFLGKAEALAARSHLFAAIDLKRRIFAKVPTRGAVRVRLEQPAIRLADPPAAAGVDGVVRDAGFDASPTPQIVVDRDGRLALANLHARMLFGLTPRDLGRPIQDLEISFRPVELRSRIEQAYIERHAVTLREVEWHGAGELRYLDVQVSPLVAANGESVGANVTFVDATRSRRLQEALQDAKREADTAYEELQSTVEELETTNEELQAMNEELETTNEELQATNEELETTNEELQSTNEELETLNDELHQRGLALNSTNAFLDGVLTSLEAGVVVVDGELEVQAWNRGARELWGLAADEVVGRHLFNLDIGLPVEQLRTRIRRVVTGESDAEGALVPATTRRGRAVECQVSITPLRNSDGAPHGAILMMQAEPTA
jgi:two-component system CheB/CheR fusion protein